MRPPRQSTKTGWEEPNLIAMAAMANRSTVSWRCSNFGPSDALLLGNPQNAFMEAHRPRPSWGRPLYPLPANFTGTLYPAGPVAVPDSADAIDVMNDWIDFAGAQGSIAVMLDYHPPDHCSFCQGDDMESRDYCLRGMFQAYSVYNANFTRSHRCHDPMSETLYNRAQYFQWPPHAVAGTIDARLHPHLRVPNRTTYIRLGTDRNAEAYNVFTDGRISVSYTHLTLPTKA